ncbi:MAG: glycogen debranching enzyme family protein [Planctomycetes bacterium]|nr:glycogen debranching enzyme family protein [Planctomycetota bacterium]
MNAQTFHFGPNDHHEWLITNNLGDFAMGTPSRAPFRKYHGLLVLRNGAGDAPLHVLSEVSEVLISRGERFELSTFNYEGGVTHPHGYRHLTRFYPGDAPVWHSVCGHVHILRRVELAPNRHAVRLTWEINGAEDGDDLLLYPHFSMRSAHVNAHENAFLLGTPHERHEETVFQFYEQLPELALRLTPHAKLEQEGFWNRRVFYAEEQRRGYEAHEDLFCPGSFRVRLTGNSVITLEVGTPADAAPAAAPESREAQDADCNVLQRLEHSAGRYVFETMGGRPGVIAGYPWFGEWARDTLLSLDGLLLRRKQNNHAAAIIERYVDLRADGLLPNVLGEDAATSTGVAPDASLLLIRAIQQYEAAVGEGAVQRWLPAVFDTLEALRTQRVKGVGITPAGLLAADRRPEALTWMDVRIDGQPVTPRAPYAVELNALYYNALCYALAAAKRVENMEFIENFAPLAEKFLPAFASMFWNAELGYFADAHDGRAQDVSLRPNQLFAFSLPFAATSREQAASALAKVRSKLLTPCGLRTLSPEDPAYRGRYTGSVHERDLAYHQGTVWPWLLMPYMDAVAFVEGRARAAEEARHILDHFGAHLDDACLGHVSEIFDGDQPHSPCGAPAQAWSVAALVSISRYLDAVASVEPATAGKPRSAKTGAKRKAGSAKRGAKALQE